MLDLKTPPARPLVAASILSADFGYMIRDCQEVLGHGADLLHVDVMDGHFAPNLTMGVDMIRALRRHLPDAYLDVHLMVERPQDYVAAYAEAGANHFAFHIEVCQPHQTRGIEAGRLIDDIHNAGMDAGVVVNPPTPVEWIAPVLDTVEMVLIMSVTPGKSGQAFMPEVLHKARWVRQERGDKIRVEMDGGLNPTTCQQAAAAGVDVMVTASALFGADDRPAVIEAFHTSAGS